MPPSLQGKCMKQRVFASAAALHRLLTCATALLLASSCTSASFRATKEYEKGNFCAFCQISQTAYEADPRSRNNLGLCYENGLCNYTANRDTAVAHYQEAARWDIDEAKQNLRRLGAAVPDPDLRNAQNMRNNEIAANVVKALLLGVAAVASSRTTPAPTNQGYNAVSRTTCCKRCWLGKPCGNTCIERTDTCHVGPGCAC